jgi:MGT family glycosyltransferase
METSYVHEANSEGSQGRHFVIILFPDFGHINPTLEVTRQLVSRGHRVTYITDERFLAPVTEVGGGLVGYTSSRTALADRSLLSVDELLTVAIDYLIETMNLVFPLARTVLSEAMPDIIMYDFESFVAARMLGRLWERPTIQLSPYIASNQEYSVRKQMIDHELPQSKRAFEVLWKFLASHDIDPKSIESFARDYDDFNLVFLPKAFQPEGDKFDDTFAFVGPCIAADTDIVQWAPANENRGVLISLGTESNRRSGFFQTCAEAFADQSWHVVMTLGRGGRPADLSITAPNVEAHEWLPHAAVLPHMEVLVCHGGMGSVMESLYFGVPVVIVPHTPEHLVTARRICELGLGGMLLADAMSAETLRSVVEETAGDPEIRQRVAVMRESMMGAGGVQRAADQLETWLMSSDAPQP